MIISLIARLGIAALLLYAGALKLLDPTAFATDIANYHFFPALAPWLAVCLPTTELVVGIALLVTRNTWLPAASLAATVLFSTFTIAVAQAYFRHINVSCGCFGSDSGSDAISLATVVRNIGLTALAVFSWVRPSRPYPSSFH